MNAFLGRFQSSQKHFNIFHYKWPIKEHVDLPILMGPHNLLKSINWGLMGSIRSQAISLLLLLSRKVSKSFFFIRNCPSLWLFSIMGTPKCLCSFSKSISKFNSTVNNKRKKENDTHQEFLCPQGSSWGFNVLYVCNLQYVSLIIMNSSSIYASSLQYNTVA